MTTKIVDDHKRTLGEFLRYGLVSSLSYLVLFFGTFYLVEKQSQTVEVSYLVIITLVYIGVYLANTAFVFRVRSSPKQMMRYAGTIALFWLTNNLIFFFLYRVLHQEYLTAITINIVFFGFIRFLIQKKFVFSEKK